MELDVFSKRVGQYNFIQNWREVRLALEDSFLIATNDLIEFVKSMESDKKKV